MCCACDPSARLDQCFSTGACACAPWCIVKGSATDDKLLNKKGETGGS